MKLPWQKEGEPAVQPVKGRAAVIPKSYKFQIARNVTSNNFTVNSCSTVITTVKVLSDGETADSVNTWLPGTINQGDVRVSVAEAEAEGLQRVQFDAPNWIGMIITQDGSYYVEHVELPVWVDPTTNKVVSVDVPELLQKYEHRREELSRYWGRTDGPFSDFFDIIDAPKNILRTGKYIASIPGELFGGIKDLIKDAKAVSAAWQPLPPEQMPDLSQYPPIDGVDFDTFIYLCQFPKRCEEKGMTLDQFKPVYIKWHDKIRADQKGSAYYVNEIKRLKEEEKSSR
jgi:hypothetical protein